MLASIKTLGSHTKSDPKLTNLVQNEGDKEVKENGTRDVIRSRERWQERPIDVGNHDSVYDRPRSQIYPPTPISSIEADDNFYDTPESTPRPIVPERVVNSNFKKDPYISSALETPPQSPKEHSVDSARSVSKSLFHDDTKEEILSRNLEAERYNFQNVPPGHQTTKVSSELFYKDECDTKEFAKLSINTTIPGTDAKGLAKLGIGTSVPNSDANQSPRPVAPPRKHSGSVSPAKPKLSPVPPSPSDSEATVSSPTPPTRRRRLTRKISLGAKKLVRHSSYISNCFLSLVAYNPPFNVVISKSYSKIDRLSRLMLVR